MEGGTKMKVMTIVQAVTDAIDIKLQEDPTKYRTKEEEDSMVITDPLDRLRKYLVASKLYDPTGEDELVSQYKKEVDRQFSEAENYAPYPLEDVFKYNYVDMPDDLKNQMVEHEKFLKWKEAQK